jgi:hypothetical protein
MYVPSSRHAIAHPPNGSSDDGSALSSRPSAAMEVTARPLEQCVADSVAGVPSEISGGLPWLRTPVRCRDRAGRTPCRPPHRGRTAGRLQARLVAAGGTRGVSVRGQRAGWLRQPAARGRSRGRRRVPRVVGELFLEPKNRAWASCSWRRNSSGRSPVGSSWSAMSRPSASERRCSSARSCSLSQWLCALALAKSTLGSWTQGRSRSRLASTPPFIPARLRPVCSSGRA